MGKSSLIIVPLTLIVLLVTGLLGNVCCLFSPLAAAVFGVAAGALCIFFEKPADVEKSVVRGALAGGIAGLAALVGQTAGGTIAALVLSGSGISPVVCLPGLCDVASAPGTQTAWIVGNVFNACFSGLIWLALMAGLGAAGGAVCHRLLQKKTPGAPNSAGGTPAP
jgi:hypothetical protein